MSNMSSPSYEQLVATVQGLTEAIKHLCTHSGARLNRQQFADRLGIHRNTLNTRLTQDRTIPRPGKDGKWLLSEIIEWEQHRAPH